MGTDSREDSSFLPSEVYSHHTSDDTEVKAHATFMSRLWCEEWPRHFRTHEREIRDLVLDNHPEIFTYWSVIYIDSLTMFNLMALANQVFDFLATHLSELTSASTLLFLDALCICSSSSTSSN